MVRLSRYVFTCLAMLSLSARAQFVQEAQVVQFTENVLSVTRTTTFTESGRLRIVLSTTDGTGPFDISAAHPIDLYVTDRRDTYNVAIISGEPGFLANQAVWTIDNLPQGTWEFYAEATIAGDTFPVFEEIILAVDPPDPTADVLVTNVISVGSTSVTNIFEPGAISNTFANTFVVTNDFAPTFAPTNITQYLGDFTQTFETNIFEEYPGVNVFTPVTVSTNVTGTWTINLTTNNPVAIYEQAGNITSVTFSVDNTNDVALGEVILLATTNAITWPTNGLTWSTGTAPTPSNGVYNILYFRAWRDDVHGVYIGDTP